jgi:hypothetical protein
MSTPQIRVELQPGDRWRSFHIQGLDPGKSSPTPASPWDGLAGSAGWIRGVAGVREDRSAGVLEVGLLPEGSWATVHDQVIRLICSRFPVGTKVPETVVEFA